MLLPAGVMDEMELSLRLTAVG